MRVLPVFSLAAAVSAQLPKEPIIRVTVANVLLDVAVTDRKGNPVTGLKPADFRITQDGKPRPVAGAIPPPVAGANQPPRTIAFVVNDLGLSLQSMHSVREGTRRFVENSFNLRTALPSSVPPDACS